MARRLGYLPLAESRDLVERSDPCLVVGVGLAAPVEVLLAIVANEVVVLETRTVQHLQEVVVMVHGAQARVVPGTDCIWISSPCFGKTLSR